MSRYLSPEWFTAAAASAATAAPAEVVLEQVVEDGPEGRITYRVEVADNGARIVWPVPAAAADADLRISCDWMTSVAIARGEMSTQKALMEGRLRVKGNPGRLGDVAGRLAGVDPVPAPLRAETTYDRGS
jgi:hypothetical protein